MTLIGAIRTFEGEVVVLADRQETIADYAKWDQSKISIFELIGEYRVIVAASGPSNTCDMMWDEVKEALHAEKARDQVGISKCIVRTVARVTKKSILPFPRNDRPLIDCIWVVQRFEVGARGNPLARMGTFRTCGLDVNEIKKFYFTGTPLLLMKYLSDMYLEGTLFSIDEAEALAAYFLWEAKEYDPNCGKHSDVFLVRKDGTLGRQSRQDEKYWEEHFEHLKESMRFLPLLSCLTPKMRSFVDPREHFEGLRTTLKLLSREQEKMRSRAKKHRSRLENRLMDNLHRVAQRHAAKREAAFMQSVEKLKENPPRG